MSDLVRVSLSIEAPLFERLEEMVKEEGYDNRSEFIRDLIRDRLVQEQWESTQESLGTVTLIYDHHARGLSERLTDLQHHFHGAVLATTHIHLDSRFCAEMIMLRGQAGRIKELTDQMKREKGVLHAKLAVSSTGTALT